MDKKEEKKMNDKHENPKPSDLDTNDEAPELKGGMKRFFISFFSPRAHEFIFDLSKLTFFFR